MFALGVGALWVSRGREPERNFGNTLQEEVRRSLALVDYQLSVTRRWILPMLGTVSIVAGAMLFSWTITRSQDISDASSGGWFGYGPARGLLSCGVPTRRATRCARRSRNWSSASGVCASCSPLSRPANDRRVRDATADLLRLTIAIGPSCTMGTTGT